MNKIGFILPLLCISIGECNTNSSLTHTTKISLNISSARGDIVYLIKIPYFEEKEKIVDSALVETAGKSIVFSIPTEEDRLYTIKVKKSFRQFYFIPDAHSISLKAN